jgi:hypothetical protein
VNIPGFWWDTIVLMTVVVPGQTTTFASGLNVWPRALPALARDVTTVNAKRFDEFTVAQSLFPSLWRRV